MILRIETPCDFGPCPYDAQDYGTCEYYCSVEPEEYMDQHEEDEE